MTWYEMFAWDVYIFFKGILMWIGTPWGNHPLVWGLFGLIGASVLFAGVKSALLGGGGSVLFDDDDDLIGSDSGDGNPFPNYGDDIFVDKDDYL